MTHDTRQRKLTSLPQITLSARPVCGNGQLDSGELHKLSDHNIFSLSVRATENSGLSQSWAFTEDDSQLIIEDVWFVVTDASVSEDEQSDEPPVAVDDVALTESGKSVVVAVLENDYDPENHLLVVSGHTQAEHGEIRLNADNTLTYTAPVDFSGVVYVQYSISDGINAAIATVRIDVMPSVVVNPNVVAETAIGDDHGTEPFSGLSSSPTEGSDDLASSNPVSELSEKEIAEAAKDAEKAAEEAAEKIEKEALKAAGKAAEKEREAIEKAEKAAIKAAEKAAEKAAKEAEEAAKKEREAIEKAEKAAKESADDDDD